MAPLPSTILGSYCLAACLKSVDDGLDPVDLKPELVAELLERETCWRDGGQDSERTPRSWYAPSGSQCISERVHTMVPPAMCVLTSHARDIGVQSVHLEPQSSICSATTSNQGRRARPSRPYSFGVVDLRDATDPANALGSVRSSPNSVKVAAPVSRFVVIRQGSEGDERAVGESSVPTEAVLHGVLRRNPELVPAADLGFSRMVTIGFETNLVSGAADLILMDSEGRLCLVEVKKQGNTDTRRVVAQVMDYAAALWGMTLEQFEHDVLRPRLGEGDSRSLRQFVIDELLSGSERLDEEADRVLDALSETLRSGEFALVVAAPEILEGVQRVMEYLNARGLNMYGLEVSYFAGEVEAFVPRIVVRPTVGARIAGRDSQAASRSTVDRETYLEELPDGVSGVVRRFIDSVPTWGAELQWRHYGPRVRVRGSAGPKVVASIQGNSAYLVTGPLQGIDPEPAQRALRKLREITGATAETRATYPSINLRNADLRDIEAFFSVASNFVRELTQQDTRS